MDSLVVSDPARETAPVRNSISDMADEAAKCVTVTGRKAMIVAATVTREWLLAVKSWSTSLPSQIEPATLSPQDSFAATAVDRASLAPNRMKAISVAGVCRQAK